MDVTPCNLSPDITVKDFKVLFDGVVQAIANFTKNSQTQITYTGGIIASTTVVVQRDTPITRVAELEYRTRISTVNWEAEFNRIHRVLNEYEVNGAGSTSIPSFGNPSDAAFSAAWDGDTAQTVTRNALYDQLITRAPNVNPTFTGTVTVPDRADLSGNSNAANTRYVDTRVVNALGASPSLGGVPTSTAPAQFTNTNQVATAAFAQATFRPAFRLWKNNSQNDINATLTRVTWSVTQTNLGATISFNQFVCPAGAGGYYLFHFALQMQATSAVADYGGGHIQVNGSTVYSAYLTLGTGIIQTVTGSVLVLLAPGNTVGIAAAGGASNNVNVLSSSWFQGLRLGI